ncbi:MAG: ferrochelatase [Gammaproteobacteria bacterium]|nr:MAG: ferrochelatase [Gammaproteobacteria bacterium]
MSASVTEEAHDAPPSVTGVLISNLGTPDAPTAQAVRRYLAEFLWDPRVVDMPRWLWWPILHGVILRIRPARSAHSYAKVWSEHGSPLLANSQRQAAALQNELKQCFKEPLTVALGMRYGKPSLEDALNQLRAANAARIVLLPLYPQYSSSTTASTFDAVAATLKKWKNIPELRVVKHYHDEPAYIKAVAESIRDNWRGREPGERLLFSFHGLPQRFLAQGDPYYYECHKTARLIAEQLRLSAGQWKVSFQSRFGREPWLQPYTDQILQQWGGAGVKSVDVVCPGFSADCLETLEEIAMQNRDLFLQSGGGSYHYMPALNDHPAHIKALSAIVGKYACGWLDTDQVAVPDE